MYLVENISGLAGRRLLADSGDGVAAPLAVGASEDGERFYVVNGDSAGIVVVDPTAGTFEVSCPCRPSGLYRLRGDGVFRVTEAVDETIWVLDGDRNPPRMVAIPPVTHAVLPSSNIDGRP